MVDEAKSFWNSLDRTQKILGVLVILLMGLNWVFGDHYQVQASAKSIAELTTKQAEYDKLANRIDRRLYRLELAHKIPTEKPDAE